MLQHGNDIYMAAFVLSAGDIAGNKTKACPHAERRDIRQQTSNKYYEEIESKGREE